MVQLCHTLLSYIDTHTVHQPPQFAYQLLVVRSPIRVASARSSYSKVCILDVSVTKVQTILSGKTISVLSGFLRRIRTCSRLVYQIDSSMMLWGWSSSSVQESAEV